MKEYLTRLNKEQYKAATSINGYNYILAGAGSGKTATLVARVAYMLDSGISGKNILLLTFTNKAAKEMKDRIIAMIGVAASEVTACTFHSFCAMLLRMNAELIGYEKDYIILDSGDASDALGIAKQNYLNMQKDAGHEYNLKDFPSVKIIAKVYEGAVNNCISVNKMIAFTEKTEGYENEIAEILQLYKNYKKEKNLMDYEDLLFYTEKLLSADEELRKRIGRRYKYISCDEYQDTNTIQNRILNLLSETEGNLTVVGDDNQSIYAFRYANIDNILGFEKRHPDCQSIVLDTNYRSSQEILDFANAMMEYATEGKKKYLKGTFHGKSPEMIITDDSYEEADFIIDKILDRNCKLSDIAVICRGSMQSYILESKLNAYGIPFNKFGGMKFMEKAVIKDILAYLRVSVNQKDEIALFRILQLYPGIGKTYAQRITKQASEETFAKVQEKYKKRNFASYIDEIEKTLFKLQSMSLDEKLHFLLEDYYKKVVERKIEGMNISDGRKSEEYDGLYDSLQEAETLYSLASKYRSTARFLADIALEATSKNSEGDKLNITTIHSAKGLEYNTVFVMDCIEGVTPLCSEFDDENSEELRCMYVAVTRAKKELYLMIPKYYNIKNIKGYMSHFINKDSIIQTCRQNVSQSELSRVKEKTEYFF